MANKKINNGHSYIDLGLPSGTLWATCNVGASKPTQSGLYFQWGDVQGYKTEQVGKEKNLVAMIINGGITQISQSTQNKVKCLK